MDPKELQNLIDGLRAQVKELEKRAADTTDLKAKLDGIEKDKVAIEELRSSINSLKEENVALSEKLKANETPKFEPKSFAVRAAEKMAEMYKQTNNGQNAFNFELNVRAIDDGNIVSGDIPQADRDAEMNYIREDKTLLGDTLPRQTTTSDKVDWEEEVALSDDSVIFLAELDEYQDVEMTYRTAEIAIKKLGAKTKVSREKLNDIKWMAGEINNVLMRRYKQKRENAILFGDEVADPKSIKGITKYAQTFTTAKIAELIGALGATAADVNIYDCIVAIIAQIGAENHKATDVYVTPGVRALLKCEKGDDGHYLLPPFTTGMGEVIDNVRVNEHHKIETGKVLVMDRTKAVKVDRESLMIEVGLDGNDFSTDKRTVKVSERFAIKIKANDVKAFVYDTFANVKAALVSPGP